MQVRKQQLELDMEQQTGFKWGKEYVKAVYCHPAYLTYMQSTSCDGTRYHDLGFLNVEFYANFFTLLFYFHQEAF